jgi:ubiquinone/menaquinone biosynthesis C-methylase UbiE
MNYDDTELSTHYDRARGYRPEQLARWLDIVASECGATPLATIVDLGCGTGRFSAALAARFDAQVIAVDPSAKMLAHARAKAAAHEQVRYVRGAAEAIPLSDRSVDLVFMSMVLHHFKQPERVALECSRVLRTHGLALLRTCTLEQAAELPAADFFPAARVLYEQRMPSRARIRELFARAGFRIRERTVLAEIAPSLRAYADNVALKADSILASLEAREFEAGLAALRAHAANTEDRPVVEPVDVFAFHKAEREDPDSF